jgi:anti-sigma factor RsiW
MNSCNEYQQQISQYIDNQLEDSDTSELFRHLGDCEECRDFLKSILKLRSAILQDVLRQPSISGKRTRAKVGKFSISYAAAAVIAFAMFVSGLVIFKTFSRPQIVAEKTQIEYVYLTPFAPVYAIENIPQQTTHKN